MRKLLIDQYSLSRFHFRTYFAVFAVACVSAAISLFPNSDGGTISAGLDGSRDNAVVLVQGGIQ